MADDLESLRAYYWREYSRALDPQPDISGMSAEEQDEFLQLLELREKDPVVIADRSRGSIAAFLFEVLTDAADYAEDTQQYLEAVFAHYRCKRKHMAQIEAERKASDPDVTIEKWCEAWGLDDAEASRRAADEGYPCPPKPTRVDRKY